MLGPDRCPEFQSTLPVGGGTPTRKETQNVRTISIHPPRKGRDFSKIGTTAGIVAGFHPIVGDLFRISA